MDIVLEEENGYFRAIVKDAIKDLKHNKRAFVFYIEQVDAIKQEYDKEIEVVEEDGYFYLTNK